ncbi:MAG TPA: helix-turn-helix transcriptional regulator [Acidimicrobiales bacterium]
MIERRHLTVDEWEASIGQQVRIARVGSGLDQVQLASLANVSVATLSNLERGKGSQLKTVIAVARALGRTDWLESLAPEVTVSPMQMLRAKQRAPSTPMRVRTRRPHTG